MYRAFRTPAALLLAATVAAGLAACGSGGSSSKSVAHHGATPKLALKPGEDPSHQSLAGGQRGGTLAVSTSEDFQHFDPGESYFANDYAIIYATQRPLFIYRPTSQDVLEPDLATAVPTTANGGITDGGRTITVHIQHGVRFSPPVNREVTSADVAFAIERGANPHVVNPYFPSYFGVGAPAPIQGAQSASYKGGPLPGIRTPNRYTIVFHLVRPGAPTLIQALFLPLSSPVPREYVAPLDRHTPTTYGTEDLVATGPYMVKSDSRGRFSGIGYQTGKSATLVRNPNWSRSTYTSGYRPPANLNRIDITIGGDATVIGQQVLKGHSQVQLDTPTQATVRLAYERYPSQITFTPGSGDHYVAIDNHHGLFRDESLRKAFWASLDREAIIKARGGALIGSPMTHFLYPGVNGFAQAGGQAGPPVDYNRDVNGNHTVACKYMKQAGYPHCRYTGKARVLIVSSTNGNVPAVTQIVNSALTGLGIPTRVAAVDQSAMYSKYCQVPKQEVDACPAQGWIRDFADPQSVLYPTFYGPSITPTGNPNQGQVNDPQINAAIRRAALVVDPVQRAQAWADVDKMLVAKAVAIPEDYDNQPNIESADVAGVNDAWNEGTWDFAFTSLRSH